MRIPPLTEVLDELHVVALPMRVRFRGITMREVALLRGPAGWGEFGPFPEYEDAESAHWLNGAIEAAWLGPPPPVRSAVPVNATIPAVPAEQVPEILSRFPGARTAKVKVAEPGGSLDDDLARVRATRSLVDNVRVDANGNWTFAEAVDALRALTADGPLEYAEQPCRSVDDLVRLRRELPGIPIAADESIRRAEDPLRVLHAGGLDVAVLKVAPLGGMRKLLALADELGRHDVAVVVSSALDSAVGMSSGIAAAAALPSLELACGLGTGGFFTDDVAEPVEFVDGSLPVRGVDPDPETLARLAASPERRSWWLDRLRRCHARLVGASV